nr:DNA N-6-adenine-methyltransferase [Microbacterium sp. No. 7]
MGSHQSARAKSVTWLTPRHIIDALGPFDLDPCAAPSPRPWDTAKRHIELPEDGLTAEWSGSVWLNPPYSFAAWKWLGKLANHGDGIALIFARTETRGFVETVWRRATAVLFLHGRLHFHYPDGRRAAANAGAPSSSGLRKGSGTPTSPAPGRSWTSRSYSLTIWCVSTSWKTSPRTSRRPRCRSLTTRWSSELPVATTSTIRATPRASGTAFSRRTS